MKPVVIFDDVAPWSKNPMNYHQTRFLVISGAIACGMMLVNAVYIWGEAYDDAMWRKTDNPSVARIVGGTPSKADSIRSLLGK